LTLYRYNNAVKKYDKQRDRIKKAIEMMLLSLVSGIAMEVEDTNMYKNPYLYFYWLAQ
jgi:hypothetical protein